MRFSEAYMEYCKEFTDAPEIFHRYAAYFMISCAIRRKVYIELGDHRLMPNLWIIFVARSSLSHKSTAVNAAEKIVSSALPNLANFSVDFSHQSFMKSLEETPEGAFFLDEAGGFFKALSQDFTRGTRELLTKLYAGLSHTATYGSKTEDRRTITITNPFINILGASTMEWLSETTNESSVIGGFLPRFLFIPVSHNEKLIPFQPPADKNKRNILISKLASMEQLSGHAFYAHDAKEAYISNYSERVEYIRSRPERVTGFLSRLLDPHIHKLAMIIACDRGEFPVITLGAFTEAKLASEFISRQMESFFVAEVASSPFEKNVNRYIKFLKSRGGKAPQSEVMRALHLPQNLLKQIYEFCQESNMVDIDVLMENKYLSGGRPTAWHCLKNGYNNSN